MSYKLLNSATFYFSACAKPEKVSDCLLGVSILLRSTILIFDSGIIPTEWYFFFILLLKKEQIYSTLETIT